MCDVFHLEDRRQTLRSVFSWGAGVGSSLFNSSLTPLSLSSEIPRSLWICLSCRIVNDNQDYKNITQICIFLGINVPRKTVIVFLLHSHVHQ